MGFQKGHKYGVRFQPGRSGNPAGRPKSKTLSEALRLALVEIGDKKLDQTNAELIATAILKKARKGDVKAAAFVRDTAEGRPAQKVQMEGSLQIKERDRQVRFLAYTIKQTMQDLGDGTTVEQIWTVVEQREMEIFN